VQIADSTRRLPPHGKHLNICVTGQQYIWRFTYAENCGANDFKSIFAYSGKYTFDGENFVTDVDVSSLLEWTGAQQVRTCRFVGSRLQFISKWAPSPFDPSRTTRGIIEFEREA
jgi:heme/copper-type cytochrome/quinol oxidase subunit 2